MIGGAAGAFPPLVGWAAMTGPLDLAGDLPLRHHLLLDPAALLGARADQAGRTTPRPAIPMMPVVQGEHWTKVQMLAYTLMLLPLTIMPSVFGALGLFYAVAAALLGGRLLWYCVQLAARGQRDADGLEDVQVLAALPGPAVRGHGRRPRAAVRTPVRAVRPILILDRPERSARPTGHRDWPAGPRGGRGEAGLLESSIASEPHSSRLPHRRPPGLRPQPLLGSGRGSTLPRPLAASPALLASAAISARLSR